MSLTPIFDATLADAPRNIWQASNIFPRPISDEEMAVMYLLATSAPLIDPANLAHLVGKKADWVLRA